MSQAGGDVSIEKVVVEYAKPCKLGGTSALKGRICKVHMQPDVLCELRRVLLTLREEMARRMWAEDWMRAINERHATEASKWEEQTMHQQAVFLARADEELKKRGA